MTLLTRRTALATILSALGTSGVAHAESSRALRLTKDTPIVLLPYFIANERKLWEKNGVSVTQVPSVVGMPNLIAVSGGAIDMGVTADISIAIAALNRAQVRVIASFAHVEAMELACSSAIRSAADLPGKRVAFLQGSLSQYYFSLLMKKYQLPPTSVSMVRLTPPEMIAALLSGAIDGFVYQEPFLTKAVAAGAGRIHRIREPGLIELNACIITNETTIRENRDALRKCLRTIDEACTFIGQNPAEANKIGAAWSQMDLQITTDAVSRMKVGLSLDVPGLKKKMTDGAQWAIAEGIAKSSSAIPDFSNYFVPEILEESRRL